MKIHQLLLNFLLLCIAELTAFQSTQKQHAKFEVLRDEGYTFSMTQMQSSSTPDFLLIRQCKYTEQYV